MNIFIFRTKSFKLLFFALFAMLFIALLVALTISANVAYGIDDGDIYYDYERIFATGVEIVAPFDATEIKPNASIRLSVNLTPFYANPQSIIYNLKVFDPLGNQLSEGDAFASVDIDGKLSVSSNAPIGGTIKVIADVEGTISPEYVFTIIKIPVEEVIISYNTITSTNQTVPIVVYPGQSVASTKNIIPENASYPRAVFSFAGDEEEVALSSTYAEIDSTTGLITVKNNINAPNASFKVKTTVDGIESGPLEFSIYVPTSTLEIVASNNSPISTKDRADTVYMTTYVSQYASKNNPQFSIRPQDWAYVDSIVDNAIIIKTNIQVSNAQIVVTALQDDIEASVILNIYVPATNVSLFASTSSITMGNSLKIGYSLDPVWASSTPVFTVDNSEYGNVSKDGVLTVYDVTSQNLKITVSASIDGITDDLTFDIIVPEATVDLVIDNVKPVSSSTIGEKFTLTALPDSDAIGDPVISVLEGSAYIKSRTNDTFTLKTGISAINPYIIFQAKCVNAIKTLRVDIYIPAEAITISSSVTQINEGSIYSLHAPIISPSNSNNKGYWFEIIDGGQYASINADTGLIAVTNTVGVANAKFKVQAFTIVDGNKASNILEFSIYVPTKSISFSAKTYVLNSKKLSSDSVVLTKSINSDATNTAVKYRVINGQEYIHSSYLSQSSGSHYLTGSTLKVAIGIAVKNAKIVLRAIGADCESSNVEFSIYIPIESDDIVFSTNIADARYDLNLDRWYVQRERSYAITAKMTKAYASASNASQLTYSLISSTNATIDANTGIVSVKETALIEGSISVRATSVDGTYASIVVYVEAVYATAINSIAVYRANGVLFNLNSDYALPGEKLEFAVVFNPFNQNSKTITLSSEHNNGSYNATVSSANKTVTIPSASNIRNDNPLFRITVKSSQNGVSIEYSQTINIKVKVPVTSFTIGQAQIDRGGAAATSLITKFNTNNYATNKGWTYTNLEISV
ncbi:MAG: hypothetical protein LBE09_02870, partial [Christensenellaceae bacterium]|nr:hypothetical protein [Christensenellaceae bacterium]